MCGFVGFVNDPKIEDSERVVRLMADRIRHRGPDQDDYYVDGDVALGFRRLSIIDLDGGSQPIYNEDKSMVLVYNGEVYNFRELREELISLGHVFATKTDSEVVLHGYEQFGSDILNRLRGMFAFVIWDKRSKKLFGARDIFGIKPFYYYFDGESLLFGSEIKAFLDNPLFKKEFNEERLPEYLCFEYIPSEQTLFKNVFKLPMGHYLEWQNGKPEIKKYFEIKYDIDEKKSLEEWTQIIEKTFEDSTVVHGISDVEVGCFLSSGVDSSYVVNEMAKNNDVKTFSVGFEELKYSELPNAEEFAEWAGVKNFSKKISAEEFFGIAPTVQYYMDEPLPNPSAVALWFLARKASEQVKVVLSGEGADELFGGYHYYIEPLDYEKYRRLVPSALRRALAGVASKMPDFHGKRFLTRAALDMDERFIRNNYVYHFSDCKKLLAPEVKAPVEDMAVHTKKYFDKAKALDDITKMQYVDMHTWLQHDILQKADKMSMASSLELRVPFLDREMLAVALQIPSRYRVGKEITKIALRGAAAKQLPEKTAKMRKMGFPVPLNDWLKRDEFYSAVKEKFESDTAAKFFNRDYIISLLDDHKNSVKPNMKKIWSVYSFLLWYERYFITER